MNVDTLVQALSQWKNGTEVTIGSPLRTAHAYPLTEMYLAEHDGKLTIILQSDEKITGTCHRCEEGRSRGTMTYMLDYFVGEKGDTSKPRTLFLNVTLAYKWAQTFKQPEMLQEDVCEQLIIKNLSETFCGAHVDHVNIDVPALLGTWHGKLLLMDGTHRLLRRFKLGYPGLAYVLTEEQTKLFIISDTPREVKS